MFRKPGFVGRVKILHALNILRRKAGFQSCNQSSIIKAADSHVLKAGNPTENGRNFGL